MSSGFVSGGTVESSNTERGDEWAQVQQELDTQKKSSLQSEQVGAAAGRQQDEGKSLYEVLQANKEKKQLAFEEANRLKNQFRALDDDEIDFLDSVAASSRAKEAAIRQETAEQLEIFRKQQQEENQSANSTSGVSQTTIAGSGAAGGEDWTVKSRKRKAVDRDRSGPLGVKLRRSSSNTADRSETVKSLLQSASDAGLDPNALSKESPESSRDKTTPSGTKTSKDNELSDAPVKASSSGQEQDKKPAVASPSKPSNNLGLGGYSSDEED